MIPQEVPSHTFQLIAPGFCQEFLCGIFISIFSISHDVTFEISEWSTGKAQGGTTERISEKKTLRDLRKKSNREPNKDINFYWENNLLKQSLTKSVK